MEERNPILAWLLEVWPRFIALLLAIGAVAGIVALSLHVSTDNDCQFSAAWPQRLSSGDDTYFAATLSDRYVGACNFESASVELFYGRGYDAWDVATGIDVESFHSVGRADFSDGGEAVVEMSTGDFGGGEDNETTEAAQQEASEQPENLVARVEIDGEAFFYKHRLDPSSRDQIAVTFDRPLYQPGQTIHLRALVVDATSGRPVDDEVRIEIFDPKSNLVLDEKLSTGPNGVASVDYELADRCLQGEYRVEVSVLDATVTRTVEVRPFRLPRFKVRVEPPNALLSPGDSAEVMVIATYTYGEPVTEASVTATAAVGNLQLEPISGRTNEDGRFTFPLSLPENAPAGSIRIDATVTSPSGRAESGSGSVATAGRTAKVELVPANQASFVYSRSQRAFAIVTEADGTPISGAKVTLVLNESEQERTVEVTTDKKGRAAFEWAPTTEGAYATVTVVASGETLFNRNINIAAVNTSPAQLELSTSVAAAGDTIDVTVRRQTRRKTGAVVALWRDGVVLTAKPVASAESVELKLPDTAAGLCEVLLVMDGSVTGGVPLWVRQAGGERVGIELDQTEYKPGSEARATLSFPPGKTTGDQPPVTYGFVGVDEALYALKERAGVPLHVLMRNAPAKIASALAVFDTADADDPTDISIATHRFRQSLQGTTSSPNRYAEDMTSIMRRYERRGWLWFLMIAFGIGAFACVGSMARITWRFTEKSIFSWKRLGAQLGFALLCGAFAVGIGSEGGDALFGGLTVWGAISICWLVAAASRHPSLSLARWLALHVGMIALLIAAGACASELSRGPGEVAEWLLMLGLGLPVVTTAIQWFLWSFVLLRERETMAGLTLASIAGAALLGPLLMTAGSGGRFADHSLEKMAPSSAAPMAQEEMAAGFGQAGLALRGGKSAPPPPPGGQAAAPRVRSWFPETMIWVPELASDANGNAKVEFEVPDSITTWRLNAWANTTDGRFGEGQASLRAVQPYFVEVDVPTQLTAGDRFEVPVTLVNRSGDPLTVEARFEAEGALTVRGNPMVRAVLDARERYLTTMNVVATDAGTGNITVSSVTDEGVPGDAVRRSVSIRADGRVLRTSHSAIVGEGWETTLATPEDALPQTQLAEVRVYSSLVADALSGLSSMVRMPSGCFEQTSSANYPNIMVLRALRDTPAAKWPEGEEDWAETKERAEKFVRLGYQKMLTFQKADGGFALYPTSTRSDIMLTAYGILQLVWASEVTTVDPEVIRRAARWLTSQQNEDGSWPAKNRGVPGSNKHDVDYGRVRATAFAVMALASIEGPEFRSSIDRALVRMEDRLESVESANALAYAANAFADAGSKQAARKAVDRLASMVQRDGDRAFWNDARQTWMGGWGYYSTAETTALAAQALLATESQVELVQPVLNWIARTRGAYGGFGSTQSTVWTLRALETLRSKSSKRSVLRFYWGSEQLSAVDGKPELVVDDGPQPLRQFEFIPPSREGRFVTDASAETSAMIQLVNEYAVPWSSRHAEIDDEPFGGEVEVADRRMGRGRTVRAFARIENLLQNDAANVIVELPVPPGAFVPDEPLEQLRAQGAISSYEILPTHIRLYVDGLPKKDMRVFAYEFVPLVRGTFSLPPLRAYPFYSPEPTSEVDAGDVRID